MARRLFSKLICTKEVRKGFVHSKAWIQPFMFALYGGTHPPPPILWWPWGIKINCNAYTKGMHDETYGAAF